MNEGILHDFKYMFIIQRIINKFLVLLFSGAVIFILAPVEDENKPLDETEQMVNRHRSRVVLSVLSALTLLFLVTGLVPIANNITLSLLVSAVMLILGIMKNKRG